MSQTNKKSYIAKASVFDVAKYILSKKGPITAVKLQKLVYYSQVWSLVWDERPLFSERIEAWTYGPVVPKLYQQHRGQWLISKIRGSVSNLDWVAKETIDEVLAYYGDKTSVWLSDLSHMEAPWRDARGTLHNDAHSGEEITLEAILEYYSGLEPES